MVVQTELCLTEILKLWPESLLYSICHIILSESSNGEYTMVKVLRFTFLCHPVYICVKCTGETSEIYTAIGDEYADSLASHEYQHESSASGSCEGDTALLSALSCTTAVSEREFTCESVYEYQL